MAALSDKAIKTNYAENKFRYNSGSELQNKEFNDGSGLEIYEMAYRGLDPQLGRFTAVDPLANGTPYLSPYLFAGDKPESSTYPSGAKQKLKNVNGDGPPGLGQGGGGINGPNIPDDNFLPPNSGNWDSENDGGGWGSCSVGTYNNYWSTVIGYLRGQPSGKSWDASDELTGSGLDVSDQAIGADQSVDIGSDGSGTDDGSGGIPTAPSWTRYQVDGINLVISDQPAYGNLVQGSDYLYSGDIMRIGVNTSNLGYSSYQWMQDININDDGWNMDQPSFNGFYYPSGDPMLTRSVFASGASGTSFLDVPGTPFLSNTYSNTTSFRAQATLIGINGQGVASPLLSINWGYSANLGAVWSWPISFSQTPNATTQAAINTYNATK